MKRVFVYENGAIIENIYLEDKADDSPLIWLQAAYLDVPFTIDTDLNVVIEDSATPNFDKIVECLIQMEFERIRYSSDGGEVPHIYSAMCDWIMEKEPDIKIKKAFLYIYPQEPDPPGGMIFY